MKNPIKSIVSFLLMLVFSTVTAFAQWAGPDQELVRSQTTTQIVTLSVINVDPNACYVWTGPNIIGDANQPTVMATPEDSVQTYICKRYDQLGVAEDDVIVRIKDSVTIVSVKPVKECFQVGDAVSTDQFEIVTDPVGYENQVTVTPSVVMDNNGVELSNGMIEVELTFSLTVNGITTQKKTNIDVISPDRTLSATTNVSVFEFVKMILTIDSSIKKASDISKKVSNAKGLAKLGAAFVKPSWSWHLGGLSLSTYHYACCNDKTIWVVPFQWGGGYVEIGCGFNIPVASAAFASVYINAGIKGRFELGPFNLDISKEEGCTAVSFPATLSATIYGAVGVCLLHPDVLSAELGLEGQGSVGCVISVIPKLDINRQPIAFKASVTGKITYLSLFTEQVKWTFAEWSL